MKDEQLEIVRMEELLIEARNALAGGLWDFGPEQDEHAACNAVIVRIDEFLDGRKKSH